MDGIERRQGHFLPHWIAQDGSYFLTLRLADSMPKLVVEKFDAEYRQIVRVEEQALRRKLNVEEISKAKTRLRNRLEKYLDAGHGACYLARAECAAIVREALQFFDGERYSLGAWVIMPNHAHAIVKPSEAHDLNKIVKSWKSFTSRRINSLVGRSGALWQSEPFDHLIRNGNSFLKLTGYVLDNPRTAGLGDWPWSGVGSLGPQEPQP